MHHSDRCGATFLPKFPPVSDSFIAFTPVSGVCSSEKKKELVNDSLSMIRHLSWDLPWNGSFIFVNATNDGFRTGIVGLDQDDGGHLFVSRNVGVVVVMGGGGVVIISFSVSL